MMLPLIAVLFPAVFSATYSDAFCRNTMFPLASAAYSAKPQDCLTKIFGGTVTGHSLGGAMASLAASYIAATNLAPGSSIKLVTLGQPRTGDKTFSATHDKQFDYSFRLTHWRDLVPHVPMENFEGYYHHKSEAFYKEAMGPSDVTVCSDEDSKCSDGLDVTTSLDDHLHYFGKDVSAYGEGGCK